MSDQHPSSSPNGAHDTTTLEARLVALREEIREGVKRRNEAGEVPEDDTLDLLQAELWAAGSAAALLPSLPVSLGAEFAQPAAPDLTFTVAECEILPSAYPIAWQVPVIGQAHAALRRQVNAEVRRYVDPSLARQTRLNYRLTELLQLIARDHGIALTQLRQQVGQANGLRMELDALRAELGILRAELHGLRAEAEGAREELRRLRAEARLQRRAVEQGSGPDTALPLDYLAYNARVGGGIEHERSLYAEFLELFAEADGLVLDLGCGRAPFLDLLRAGGRAGLGVDRDPRIVAYARAQGHRVIEADVLTFLETVEDGTIGGIFAAHLVEHLPRPALVGFIERCRRKLAPGARAVFITPDPRSLFVLSDTFYKDLTHVAPIHPAALSFLAEQAGFASREVRTLSPVPATRRLEGEDEPGTWSPALRRNLAKVEELLFGDLDYALIVGR